MRRLRRRDFHAILEIIEELYPTSAEECEISSGAIASARHQLQ